MTVSMRTLSLAALAAAGTLLAPLAASAASAKEKQAELRKMCDAVLADAYKAKPELKAAVGKAAGYGCFTSFGMSFFVGGAGGSGLVHNSASKATTYMKMAQASGGLDFGVKDYRELLIFKNAKAMETFVTKGWEFGGGGSASAKASGTGATADQSMITSSDVDVVSMTKNGLAIGVAATGRKYWKDDELNAAK